MSDSNSEKKSVLDLKFLSHGTLEVHDINKSSEFYQAFLGLEFVRTTEISGMVRLGSEHVMVVVEGGKGHKMAYTNHNGLDVPTKADVDRAHALCKEHKEQWGIKSLTDPKEAHEVYGFYFRDMDGNWWEILNNPPGGYSWRFEKYKTEPPKKIGQ